MFRDPKYVERIEDISYELETPLVTANPANNTSQKSKTIDFLQIILIACHLQIGIMQEFQCLLKYKKWTEQISLQMI